MQFHASPSGLLVPSRDQALVLVGNAVGEELRRKRREERMAAHKREQEKAAEERIREDKKARESWARSFARMARKHEREWEKAQRPPTYGERLEAGFAMLSP